MLCEKCKKNNATVFYRENINGHERRLSLCPECAAKARENGELPAQTDPFESMFTPFAEMGSLFTSMFAPPELAARAKSRDSEAKRCPLCGCSFDDLVSDGKAGCPKCYDAFSAELDRTVKRIHGNVTHSGRAPKLFRAKLDRTKRLDGLKKELKSAVDEQNFERAAELRDEIRALEGEKSA